MRVHIISYPITPESLLFLLHRIMSAAEDQLEADQHELSPGLGRSNSLRRGLGGDLFSRYIAAIDEPYKQVGEHSGRFFPLNSAHRGQKFKEVSLLTAKDYFTHK